MHSSKCASGYSELINFDICNEATEGEKISSFFPERIVYEMMRAFYLLVVTSVCTHKPYQDYKYIPEGNHLVMN